MIALCHICLTHVFAALLLTFVVVMCALHTHTHMPVTLVSKPTLTDIR